MFVVLWLLSPTNVVGDSQAEGAASNITVNIDFGNGTILSFEDVVADTVYNATRQVVNIEEEWYGDLVFITSIAGVANDPDQNRWWQYWVNGVLGPVAANKYHLEDGDLVEWRLPSQNATGELTTFTDPMSDPSLLVGMTVTGAVGLGFLVALFARRTTK